ncbi:uncharacterized protein LOC123562631 [Mercenaria mercenaria]|uniref:uncharacterized protein LOC123562631 n=1 Tax=Mercenaria mercenaria TaxID=6596 RepID=UPI00234F8D41|nr:uncharacterized protein LOC123562631 [Mercenaria mercenaria]
MGKMTCLTRTSFWMAAFSLTLMLIAWFMPLWLGRRDEQGFKHYFGLFYRMYCSDNGCMTSADVFSSKTILLDSGEWHFDIVVIPILSTLSLVSCAIGILILEFIVCGCGKDFSLRPLIGACIFLFILSGILGAIAVFLSIDVARMYSHQTSTDASEFPWSVLVMAIAVLLVLWAGISYLYITCRWAKFHDTLRYRTFSRVDHNRYTIDKRQMSDNTNIRRYRRHFNTGASDSPALSRYGASTFTDPAYVRSSGYNSYNGLHSSFSNGGSAYRVSDGSYYGGFRVPRKSKSLNNLDDLEEDTTGNRLYGESTKQIYKIF